MPGVKAETRSWATSPASRKSMLGNRQRDTRPEHEIRKRLHAAGMRYRVAARPIPTLRRTADVLFSRQKVAAFIDGCYWHGCPQHYKAAKSNAEFWSSKIERNCERDRATTGALRDAGCIVLRFWEHEDPAAAATSIERVVSDQGRARSIEAAA